MEPAARHQTVSVDVVRCAEQAVPLLRRCLGAGVRLQRLSLVKDGIRCVVMRGAVEGGPPGVTSVILKQVKPGKEPRGLVDGASLAFLTSTRGAQGIAPRFYGGSVEHGLFAMEDLGEAPTLEDLLCGTDPGAAQRALRSLAAQTGRMHAETKGREEQLRRYLEALPDAVRPDAGSETARWQVDVEKGIEEWCQAARCRAPGDFKALREWLHANVGGETRFHVFTHGDPAPSNCLVVGDTARLLDFEYGGFRHPLYDLTAWYVLCPLPEDRVEEMSQSYREALAPMCPEARDEQWYRFHWAMLCSYRALALLSWIPRPVLTQDRPWVDEWTARQAVLCTLDRLSHVTTPFPGLVPLAEWGLRLGTTLRARWPETTVLPPHWPALQP